MENKEKKAVDSLVDEVLQGNSPEKDLSEKEDGNLTQGLSVTDILDSMDDKKVKEEFGVTEILKEEHIAKEMKEHKKKKKGKKSTKLDKKAPAEEIPLGDIKLGQMDEEVEKQKQEFFETHHQTQSLYGNPKHKRVINIEKKNR